MDVIKQVCSLELSKRLKELGYPQESLWYWGLENIDKTFSKYILMSEQWSNSRWKASHHKESFGDYGDFEMLVKKFEDNLYSAPTSGELGMALPYRLRLSDDDYWLQIFKEDDFWEIRYFAYKEGIPLRVGHKEFSFQADTEAEARGFMWEYLKKNGLIKEKNG